MGERIQRGLIAALWLVGCGDDGGTGPTSLSDTTTLAETTGRDVSDVVFAYVFGLFKIAVIAQQIYFRFQQGLTKDPRFAAMITSVRLLGRTAVSAMDKGRIDRLG